MFKSIEHWTWPSLQSNKSVLEWLFKVWVQPCVCVWRAAGLWKESGRLVQWVRNTQSNPIHYGHWATKFTNAGRTSESLFINRPDTWVTSCWKQIWYLITAGIDKFCLNCDPKELFPFKKVMTYYFDYYFYFLYSSLIKLILHFDPKKITHEEKKCSTIIFTLLVKRPDFKDWVFQSL